MKNNILISSVGQRVVLVEIFKATIKKLGLPSLVYGVDMNPKLAPAGYVTELCFEVCRCTDPRWVGQLLDICRQKDIGIIIPTIDTELQVLSDNAQRFLDEGIRVVVSSQDFIRICRDKRKTMELFDAMHIPYPKPCDKNHPVFPMFAKPYDGSLSTNLHVIRTSEDLTQEILMDEKLIFMEYIDTNEFKEFTVDMYYGSDNQLKCVVPRERIKIRAGEINKGITRKNGIVNYLRERMSFLPGVIGTICLQLFYREQDQRIYAIEINPRFGGGYPLTYWAHASFPEMILREYLLQQAVDYTEDWLDNTLMLRYDKEIVVYDA